MSSNNPFSDNPYASPAAIPTAELMSQPNKPTGSLYRDGRLLVTTKDPSFPPICLVTNQPTDKRLMRKMTWHHPALYLAIIPGILIYAILATVLQKKAKFYVPLAPQVLKRRFRMILLGWVIALASAGALFGACVFEPQMQRSPLIPMLAIGAPFGCILGALVGSVGGRTVYPAKIDDHFVWLKGVSPEYLKQLPDFPWMHP